MSKVVNVNVTVPANKVSSILGDQQLLVIAYNAAGVLMYLMCTCAWSGPYISRRGGV